MIEDFFDFWVYIEKRKVPDGLGGAENSYVEGIKFKGAATNSTSLQVKIAEQQGVTSVYKFVTNKSNTLEYGDIIKKASSDLYLRITSNAAEGTPSDFLQTNTIEYSAERFTLPD